MPNSGKQKERCSPSKEDGVAEKERGKNRVTGESKKRSPSGCTGGKCAWCRRQCIAYLQGKKKKRPVAETMPLKNWGDASFKAPQTEGTSIRS